MIIVKFLCTMTKTKWLNCYHDKESIVSPYKIYIDFESMLKNKDNCENNPKSSYATEFH